MSLNNDQSRIAGMLLTGGASQGQVFNSNYRERPTGIWRYDPAQQLRYKLFGNKHEQPINYDPYGIAGLTRQQYQDYMTRFRPREDWLINYATDQNKPMEDAQKARGYVGLAFAGSEAGLDRRLSGLGVSATPEQRDSFKRTQTYLKGISEVDAMNRTAQSTYDRQMGILTGSSPSIDLSDIGRGQR